MKDDPKIRDEETEMMLPFHATGRLLSRETARVEQYLNDHPNHLQVIMEEKQAIVAGNEAISPVRARNFAKVAAKLSLPSARSAGSGARLLGAIRRFFEMPTARSVQWAGAAAIILIIAQGATIGRLAVTRSSDQFITASGAPASKSAGSFASIRFADSATYPAIATMLAELHVSIVDGPLGGGLFTVRIGPQDMRDAERDRIIEALKAQRGIVAFVVPLR